MRRRSEDPWKAVAENLEELLRGLVWGALAAVVVTVVVIVATLFG